MILRSIFDLPQKNQRILELEDRMADPNLWADQDMAKAVAKEATSLKGLVERWGKLETDVKELSGLAKMAETEPDKALETDLKAKFELLKSIFDDIRLMTFLADKYDHNSAILSIHAGAGGVDAQDWSEMLFRMYSRYADKKGYKLSVIDESRGGEAGIKSIVFEITGDYAYGYFKSEAGVHRLVRQSPFNSSQTRETSFALVEVLPEIQQAEFKLDLSEIDFEAKTSRGHGGQSVNTTYSAIRATHIPTGITVTIQNERSQAQNKDQAIKILASKIAALEEERQLKEKLELRGEYHSAEWGSQIRSYVLHPYKLVKDHRTNYETSDAEGVLEGNLDEFVKSYLEFSRNSVK
ncbi:MAG: peptide chain release factor 2 [Candidatus Doudnabacteria bacterium]|nr:peptide chain release factor 2 [Candidatus Doudnabacteria bacterium]